MSMPSEHRQARGINSEMAFLDRTKLAYSESLDNVRSFKKNKKNPITKSTEDYNKL